MEESLVAAIDVASPEVRALAELGVSLHAYKLGSLLRSKWVLFTAVTGLVSGMSWLSSYQRAVTIQVIKSMYYGLRSKSIRNVVAASMLMSIILKALGVGTFKQRFSLSFALLWSLYYRYNVVEHARLRYHRTFWNVHIVEKARLTKESFNPVFWAFNRHAQTIVCFVLQMLESHVWSKYIAIREEIVVVPANEPAQAKGDWDGNTGRSSRGSSMSIDSKGLEKPPKPMKKPTGDVEYHYLHWYYEHPIDHNTVKTKRSDSHPSGFSSREPKLRPPKSTSQLSSDMGTDEDDEDSELEEYDEDGEEGEGDEGEEEQRRTSLAPWRKVPEAESELANSDARPDWRDDAPIMFMIHGLGDDYNHPYMRRWAKMCRKHGWRAVSFSYWRIDFLNSRDLELCLNHVARSYPRAPIIAVAWSAGGHILGSYLGQVGKKTPLVGAVFRSACWNFPTAVSDVESNENSSYSFFLQIQTLECCRRHIQYDKSLKPELKKKLEALLGPSCFLISPLELYDRFIYTLGKFAYMRKAQLNVPYKYFENTAEHWENPAEKFISGIGISTLVLHARDDPVVSNAHVRWRKLWANKHVITAHTKRGGHVSWFEGWFPIGPSYGDRLSANFASALLESHAQTNFLVDVIRRTFKANAAPLNPSSMARICSASDLSLHWKSAANLRSMAFYADSLKEDTQPE
eukprot:g32063.t1